VAEVADLGSSVMSTRVFCWAITVGLLATLVSRSAGAIRPGTRFELPGAEFASPASKGWRVERNGYQYLFGKKFSKTHSRVIEVSYGEAPDVTEVEEFRTYVQERWQRAEPGSGYTKVSDEVVPDARFSTIGVRASRCWQDHRTNRKGAQGYLLVEDYAHIFVHPGRAEIMVTVLYSIRRAPAEKCDDAADEMERLFGSLVLGEIVEAEKAPAELLQGAEVQMNRRNWRLARRNVDAALVAYRQNGDQRGMADCHLALGKLARMAGDQSPDSFRHGIELHSTAISMYLEVGWLPGAALAHAERAQLHFLLGEKDLACADYESALSSYYRARESRIEFEIPIYNPRASTFDDLVRIFMSEVGCEAGKSTATDQ